MCMAAEDHLGPLQRLELISLLLIWLGTLWVPRSVYCVWLASDTGSESAVLNTMQSLFHSLDTRLVYPLRWCGHSLRAVTWTRDL